MGAVETGWALKNISVFLIKGGKNYEKNIRKNGTIRKKGGNMDKYTKFILTVIAVAMIGILFKGQIIKPVKADMGPVNWEILVRLESKIDHLINMH